METQDCKIVELNNGGERKIQNVSWTENGIMQPTQKLLEAPFDAENFRNVITVHMYLNLNKQKLQIYKDALVINRFINQTIRTKVEHIVKQMEKNIPLLQKRMELYYNSILQKNKELKLTAIPLYFKDETEFDTFMQNITLLYSDPAHNAIYGTFCRSILVELEKIPNSDTLLQLKEKCMQKSNSVQEIFKVADSRDCSSIREDMREVSISLENLIKLCDIISSRSK